MSRGQWRKGSKAERLSSEFNASLQQAHTLDYDEQLNCDSRPDLYVDYEATDRPSKKQAAWLCEGCPLRAQCREYARSTKPGWGVWGGEVWVNGSRSAATGED